jgi:hypothetical protein
LAAQPADRALRYENEYSAIAEEGVVRCLVADPPLVKTARENGLTEAEFTSPLLAKVFAKLLERDGGAELSLAVLLSSLTSPEASRITTILQRPASAPNGGQALLDYIDRIRTERLKSKGGNYEDILAVQRKYKEKKGLGGVS